ncbi:haloacid dehalogenase [Lepidopterella palustris CBS 459.81]|uniref:Haloacid dehalogenase n=1 Tax=Lepidopterella palustris CBS 459.81 TaxID=1314670 RepID=A0A8E2E889_9PEZI|nr:haloacid dehalogenase [Lepidopterella palustris CBS 459.81]
MPVKKLQNLPIDNNFKSPMLLPTPSKTAANVTMALSHPPRALLFDVFGTCVDWRTPVTKALDDQNHTTLNSASVSLASTLRMRASSMDMDAWGKFAQEWRNTYKAFTKSIADDPTLAWKTVDEHHFDSLKQLLVKWELAGLWNDDEIRALSFIWHRLTPWSDTSSGIKELNKLFWTVTLSNGNLALLDDLRVYADMDFTHVFSAELFGSYKPSPVVYRGAVNALGLQPVDCAMVACHLNDLKAAKSNGLQVIYVERPLEEDWSQQEVENARNAGWVDLWIGIGQDGFLTMAEKLGVDVGIRARRAQSA